jgi:hypothetical protein
MVSAAHLVRPELPHGVPISGHCSLPQMVSAAHLVRHELPRAVPISGHCSQLQMVLAAQLVGCALRLHGHRDHCCGRSRASKQPADENLWAPAALRREIDFRRFDHCGCPRSGTDGPAA